MLETLTWLGDWLLLEDGPYWPLFVLMSQVQNHGDL